MKSKLPRVGVEICTCDRPSELAMLLTSLHFQTFQDFDIFIVDEGTTSVLDYKFVSDTINRLKLGRRRILYQRNQVRRGIGHARNLANQMHDNPLCCRIDDDSVLDPFYLKRLYAGFFWDEKELRELPQDAWPEVERGMKMRKDVGAVGGIVPLWGVPTPEREPKYLKGKFNEITFKADRVEIGDDGGYIYVPNAYVDSDHLRSSFMYSREAADKVGLFPEWNGIIGWREETVFCMKLKWAGYKMLTDTAAICWHAPARSGGARLAPEAYQQLQMQIEGAFQKWAMRKYKQNGEKYG